MAFRLALCTLFILPAAIQSVQIIKDAKMGDAGKNKKWNPADLFRTAEDSARVSTYVKKFHLKGNASTPRMLISQGCELATPIMAHAVAILALHDIEAPEESTDQILVNNSGSLSKTISPIGAMTHMHQFLASRNKSLVFKGTIGKDQELILSRTIFDMGTLVAEVSRRNKVDQLVCMVKDCFDKDFGHPLLGNKETDMCFKRRNKNPTNYKAFVNSENFLENLKRLSEVSDNTTNQLQDIGYFVEPIASEDLLDFQWNKDALGVAVRSWSDLLKLWGIGPNQDQLTAYLEKYAGTRPQPMGHKKDISNINEITDLINTKERFTWMLRQ